MCNHTHSNYISSVTELNKINKHCKCSVFLHDITDSELNGTLERIDGCVNFRHSPYLTSLKNLQIITGELDLRDTCVESLGKLRFVGGDLLLPLRFENIDINKIKVKGKIKYFNDSKSFIEKVKENDYQNNLINPETYFKEIPKWNKSMGYVNYFTKIKGKRKDFLDYFHSMFLKGEYIDLKGNDNYIYALHYKLFYDDHRDPHNLYEKLKLMWEHYPIISKFEIRKLYELFPTDEGIKILIENNCLFDDIILSNIKYLDGETFTLMYGRGYFRLKIDPSYFYNDVDDILNEYGKYKIVSELKELLFKNDWYIGNVFSEELYNEKKKKKDEFFKKIFREAENRYRERNGKFLIGEKWVGETSLYYSLCENFKGVEIKKNYSPSWLGRQHLDIYFPLYNIAVEYQGEQHDKPIDFFGGLSSFIENKKRDEKKKSLCNANGCRLFEYRKGDSLEELIISIKNKIIKK